MNTIPASTSHTILRRHGFSTDKASADAKAEDLRSVGHGKKTCSACRRSLNAMDSFYFIPLRNLRGKPLGTRYAACKRCMTSIERSNAWKKEARKTRAKAIENGFVPTLIPSTRNSFTIPADDAEPESAPPPKQSCGKVLQSPLLVGPGQKNCLTCKRVLDAETGFGFVSVSGLLRGRLGGKPLGTRYSKCKRCQATADRYQMRRSYKEKMRKERSEVDAQENMVQA